MLAGQKLTLERYTLFTHQCVNNSFILHRYYVYFEGFAGSLKSPGAELLTLIYRPRLNYAGQNLSNPHSQESLHGVKRRSRLTPASVHVQRL